MFQGIFKSAINDTNINYIFGTGSIPINIKSAQLATFADGTTKQQGYQVAEVNKLISTMLTGWDKDGNKPKSMSDNYVELILSCDNGFVVKKRLQFPHIIAWKDDSTPYNIADVYKEFSIDNWLKADDFENPDITLVVEPTDEILTTSTATPPEATTTNSGRFYLYYRNLPIGVNRIHIDFHIKTKTEPIDFDLEIADGMSWKDAQTILASNEQAKINVLLSTAKDVYKYTGVEGDFENITMHEWSALYQQIISLAPNNKFTHDLYFYIYDELDGIEYDLSGDFVFSDGYAINAVPEQSNYGKYVNISSETLCATPNYIDVSRFVGKMLELSFVNVTSTAGTTWGLCFYDADKIPVSAKRFENTGVFEETICSVVIPVNAVYIRTTFVLNSNFSAKINYKGKINEIQENINEIQKNIEPLLGSEKIIEITNPSVGKIINLSGQVSALSAYNISEPILVNKGDVVKCSFGCEKNVSAICITELGDVTTRKHTLIQAGQGYNVAEYRYIANENCYIEFCYVKNFGISNVSITEASIKDDVKFLERDVETLKYDVETLKDDDKLPYENLMVKMLCIGDSLTEGAEGDVDGIIGKNRIKTENYSYYIKLLTRLDINVEGHSGMSASDFWNGCTVQNWDGSSEWFYGFKDNAEGHEYDFTPYDSFVIWLGTNNGLTDSLDTDVIPFTNYNDFADTETGCYCKIISKIISKVPHAKIFLGNVYASKGNVAETNATLEKIAQLYSDNVMGVVNNNDGTLWLQGSSFQTLYHNNNNNVHFNKVGEFVLAEHWVNGIRRLIKENLIKFKNPILPVADRS